MDYFQARSYASPWGRFTSPDPANAGVDLTDPQSWNGYSYVSNRPLTDTDPSGLQSCPAPCISYSPVPGQPSGGDSSSGLGGGGGFGFTLWQSSTTTPPVQTLSAPYLPLQNTPFDAFIGLGKQAVSDVVSGLSSFVNGDNPTEPTRWLLWQLRPPSQRQQAGANILPILSMAVPFGGGTGEAKLGSLLPGEVRRIQQFANAYNTEIYVVGSRAAGTAGEFSDFDYLIKGTSKVRQAARRFLPRGKAGGEIRGYSEIGIDIFNANKTPLDPTLPYIKFTPNP